ncbi:hypothetical protein B0G81_0653 [Paraburkholderia sp. BL6665CI2N2]|nr:hypothetical protein B0G81_0653 [Paraburkholderia sp. BL6665CI2N2]
MQSKRIRLDILTPSSNTALEPMTAAMLSELPHVSAHFARFTVTEIALSEQALGQFDVSRILAAARQLAEARVDVEPLVRWGRLLWNCGKSLPLRHDAAPSAIESTGRRARLETPPGNRRVKRLEPSPAAAPPPSNIRLPRQTTNSFAAHPAAEY